MRNILLLLSIFILHSTIQAQFDEYAVYSQELHPRLFEEYDFSKMIPFEESGKWGFVENKKGYKQLLKPQFREISAVVGEYAVIISEDRKLGVINSNGILILDSIYTLISFEEELIHAILEYPKDTDKFNWELKCHKYFNLKGELVFTQDAYEYQTFSPDRDLSWFKNKDYYLYDRKGNMLKKINEEVWKSTYSLAISGGYLLTEEEINFENYVVLRDLNGTEKNRIPFNRTILTDGQVSGYKKLNNKLYVIATEDRSYYSGRPPMYHFFRTNGTFLGFMYDSYRNQSLGISITIDFQSKEYFTLHSINNATAIINKEGVYVHKSSDSFNEHVQISSDEYLFLDYSTNKTRYLNLKDSSKFFPTYFVLSDMVLGEKSIQLGFFDDRFLSKENSILRDTLESGFVNLYTGSFYDSQENFFYFNEKGERTITLSQNVLDASHFSEGLAATLVRHEDEKFQSSDRGDLVFIDKSGKAVFTVVGNFYSSNIWFKNGLALIPGKGLINKEGRQFWTD